MKPSFILTSFLFPLLFAPIITIAQGRSQHISNSDPSEITIKIINVKTPSCNGEEDGEATVKVSGGQAPYTYNWNTFPNQYSKTARNLSSGIYFIYVEDAEGNSSFKSVHIDDPNVSLLAEKSEVNVNELEITASVQGSSNFSYEINSNISEEEKIGDLPVGIHKIVITDDKNCQMVQYIQVFEVSQSEEKKSIKSTASYSNKKGKKILVSNLIPVKNDDPKRNTHKIKLEKK